MMVFGHRRVERLVLRLIGRPVCLRSDAVPREQIAYIQILEPTVWVLLLENPGDIFFSKP